MNTERIIENFQTINVLLSELQNNMNSAIPEIYLRMEEQDNRDFGQSFLSNVFWSSFELIADIESLEGAKIISWLLNSFVEDIHDNLEKYPDLNSKVAGVYERMQITINHIKLDKISPVIDNPEKHYNDVFTYQGNKVTVADFENFDFVYASTGYTNALLEITKNCKSEVLKNIFPRDKWKVSFYFGESPANPCKQCNWGCNGYIDSREFFEDINSAILDRNGKVLANNVYDWVNILSKNSHKSFVVEPIYADNVRLNQDQSNYHEKYPNGGFVNEYCLTWGRDDFFNDWVDFSDEIGEWMFYDDMNGNITNPNGFVSRSVFYYNWNLDASSCVWKRTYNPDPNN
jgi:hypothetical protein